MRPSKEEAAAELSHILDTVHRPDHEIGRALANLTGRRRPYSEKTIANWRRGVNAPTAAVMRQARRLPGMTVTEVAQICSADYLPAAGRKLAVHVLAGGLAFLLFVISLLIAVTGTLDAARWWAIIQHDLFYPGGHDVVAASMAVAGRHAGRRSSGGTPQPVGHPPARGGASGLGPSEASGATRMPTRPLTAPRDTSGAPSPMGTGPFKGITPVGGTPSVAAATTPVTASLVSVSTTTSAGSTTFTVGVGPILGVQATVGPQSSVGVTAGPLAVTANLGTATGASIKTGILDVQASLTPQPTVSISGLLSAVPSTKSLDAAPVPGLASAAAAPATQSVHQATAPAGPSSASSPGTASRDAVTVAATNRQDSGGRQAPQTPARSAGSGHVSGSSAARTSVGLANRPKEASTASSRTPSDARSHPGTTSQRRAEPSGAASGNRASGGHTSDGGWSSVGGDTRASESSGSGSGRGEGHGGSGGSGRGGRSGGGHGHGRG